MLKSRRHIAQHYGFQNVITPADILVSEPKVWPFEPLLEALYQSTARPLPAPVFRPSVAAAALTPDRALKIDGIFVFNDPRDWALDIQLIVDLLLSDRGYLGTYSPNNGDSRLPNHGWQESGQPPLYFSNADLFWSTGFPLPRLGQGAFQAAVAGVWSRITDGHELRRMVIGKPYSETYRYAEQVLHDHRGKMLRTRGHDERTNKLRTVYMIGDNPSSDIAGANAHSGANGTSWQGILVRTGVWSPERGGREGPAGPACTSRHCPGRAGGSQVRSRRRRLASFPEAVKRVLNLPEPLVEDQVVGPIVSKNLWGITPSCVCDLVPPQYCSEDFFFLRPGEPLLFPSSL